jgi:hypothetical protein
MSGAEYRPQWLSLIQEVRAIYPGPLTFAANWDAYDKCGFWDQMDYLGVDGYFPLQQGSDLGSLIRGWEPYLAALRAFHNRWNKPLLFTEIGICSHKGAQTEPWDYQRQDSVDTQLQKNYFEAFIDVFEPESFFAGFLQWNWELDPKAGGPRDIGGTVQGKPAQQLLRGYFRQENKKKAPPLATNTEADKRIQPLLQAPDFR